jgi:hypothetical protein
MRKEGRVEVEEEKQCCCLKSRSQPGYIRMKVPNLGEQT